MSEGFAGLREEMKCDEEQTNGQRRNCETRFQRIETWVETKKALNGHRHEESKKKWYSKLAFIAFLSAVVVVFIERILRLVGW